MRAWRRCCRLYVSYSKQYCVTKLDNVKFSYTIFLNSQVNSISHIRFVSSLSISPKLTAQFIVASPHRTAPPVVTPFTVTVRVHTHLFIIYFATSANNQDSERFYKKDVFTICGTIRLIDLLLYGTSAQKGYFSAKKRC